MPRGLSTRQHMLLQLVQLQLMRRVNWSGPGPLRTHMLLQVGKVSLVGLRPWVVKPRVGRVRIRTANWYSRTLHHPPRPAGDRSRPPNNVSHHANHSR